MARTRKYNHAPVSAGYGVYKSGGVVIFETKGTFTNGSSQCDDVIDGTRNDHPLVITHTNLGFKHEPCNGRSSQHPTTYREMKNMIPEVYRSMTAPTHEVIPSLSTALASTLALSRTNPSRPEVSLPVAIAELKDLPGMLRMMGRDIIRHRSVRRNYHQKVGSWYMAGVYGIAPMISDGMKLLDFSSRVDRRSAELQRLYSKGGLKRRVTLAAGSAKSGKSTTTVESTIATIRCRAQTVTEMEQWATVRWLPTSLPRLSANDPHYRKLARNVLLGLGQDFGRVQWQNARARNDFWSDAADAWELVPWSWLVDWFSNTGDFLNAKRNTIPAQSSRLNIMKTTRSVTTFTRTTGSSTWTTGGGASLTRTTKSRTQGIGPSVSADMRFLNARQLSILGALALQRLRIRR